MFVCLLFVCCFFAGAGADCPIKRLMELKVGERCCVIGTLFKKMDFKPSILKEISAVVGVCSQLASFLGYEDKIR